MLFTEATVFMNKRQTSRLAFSIVKSNSDMHSEHPYILAMEIMQQITKFHYSM